MSVGRWHSGQVCPNYFTATFIFAALKANKDNPCATYRGTDFPNYLANLNHLCVTLQWKLLFVINLTSSVQVWQTPRIIAFQ